MLEFLISAYNKRKSGLSVGIYTLWSLMCFFFKIVKMEENQVSEGSQAVYCCAGCSDGGGVNIHCIRCLLTRTTCFHQKR